MSLLQRTGIWFCSIDVPLNPQFLLDQPWFITKNIFYLSFFAFSLIGLQPDFSKLKCFGTDGEEALYTAFKQACSEAIHLLCSYKRQVTKIACWRR